MLDKIVESCRFLLNNFPEAQKCRDYLDSRISKESRELFKFGYFPDINNLHVLIDLVGEEALRDSDLLDSWQITDSLYPRNIEYCLFNEHPMIIPFHDSYGKVAALVGRAIVDEQEIKAKGIPKYKNTKNFKKKHFLFGLYENKQEILRQNCVYIVEGQFDVIKAAEKGFRNFVAIGTNNMSPYQFSVISRYTDNIFLLLDNDEAGRRGRRSAVRDFGRWANIKNFYLPDDYKDVDEYLLKTGVEELSFVIKG